MTKLKRLDKNPILTPRGYDWEALAVFNPAAIYLNGKIHLLYRAIGEYEYYISRIGHAIFDEDLNLVERKEKPLLEPDFEVWWEKSIEDARLTLLDGELYMSYVITITPTPPAGVRLRLGLRKPKQVITRIGIAKVDKDFKKVTRLGIVTPVELDERDFVIFPERINGRVAVLHRPSRWVGAKYKVNKPSIWFAYLDEKSFSLYSHKVVMEPEEDWEDYKIGAGSPPVKVEEGWLLIYHGVDRNRCYRAGAVLLDLKEPWKVTVISHDFTI